MLEVGCAAGPGGSFDVGLSITESRTHFGAWCIVSSPLILSHDTNNDTISDAIWPIISNKEAIQINQAWAGDSGSLYATVPTGLDVQQCIRSSEQCYQLWSKLLDSTKLTTAVLVINHSLKPSSTIVLDFTSIPSFVSLPPFTTYSVRDVWSHTVMGTFSQTISISPLASHDSALLIITPLARAN
jgi:alpha-galactosidase